MNLYVDFANISLDHQSFQVGVDMINAGLAAEPKAAALYVARGVLYVQLAQYDKAEADFEEADALNPQQSVGSVAEGLAAVQQNDPEHALSTVRAKLAKKPNDAFLLYLQAQILTQRGPDPGSAEFKQAMASAKKPFHYVLLWRLLAMFWRNFICRRERTKRPWSRAARL